MNFRAKYSYAAILLLKMAALIVCSYMWAFGYPPSSAQAHSYVLPVVTAEDAVQDVGIVEINKHLEQSDAAITRNWLATQANAQVIAGMQGEERIIGAVLTILVSSGLFIQISGRKKSA